MRRGMHILPLTLPRLAKTYWSPHDLRLASELFAKAVDLEAKIRATSRANSVFRHNI